MPERRGSAAGAQPEAERRAAPHHPVATPRQSAASAIHLAKDGIERTYHHDEIGDQVARSDALERLQIIQAWRAGADAVGFVFAGAHDVVAELAAWGLDGVIDVARRDAKAFADEFEVMDQRFH